MTIRIEVSQVEGTGSQFLAKRADLEALVGQAKAMMNNLQGQFTGNRANRIYSEWNGMQPKLQDAILTLQLAGDFLKKAANEFGQVDNNPL